jgi:ABC-type multidrug transport system fused ATPase/permease subunit
MCVLWFGARLVMDGKLSPGELSAFVVYAIFVSGNVAALAGVFSSLIQARKLLGTSLRSTPIVTHMPMWRASSMMCLQILQTFCLEPARSPWAVEPSRLRISLVRMHSSHT